MKEKERYEVFGKHCIKDNDSNARPQLLDAYVACVILNEQDKHIKELEQKNLFLKEQNQSLIDEEDLISKKMQEVGFDNIEDLYNSQKQLAVEKLKNLRDKICDIGYNGDYDVDYFEVMKEIDNQIKSLKGGENE